MPAIIPFYILDFDEAMIDSLSMIVKKVYPDAQIFTYDQGEEGWRKMHKQSLPSVVIADANMPDVGGLQLLKLARKHEVHQKSYFIITTHENDNDTKLQAIKFGADDFLHKPFSMDTLFVKLRNATRVVTSHLNDSDFAIKMVEFEALFEKQKEDTFNLLTLIQKARIADLAKRIASIMQAATWIGKQMTDDSTEIETIRRSAQLAYSGKMLLNDTYVTRPVMINGEIRSPIMEKYAEYVDDIYSNLVGFEEVQKSLRHIYENYDGTGIPDKLQQWEIPLASRILRVAMDFEENFEKAQGRELKAIDQLYASWNVLYDHRIVVNYDQYLGMKASTRGKLSSERQISAKEMQERMIVARHIITTSGLKLISAGTVLNEDKIEKIRQITEADPLLGELYVKR